MRTKSSISPNCFPGTNPAPLTFQGIPIQIENRAGTVREGKDPQGKPWRKLIKNDYGFIERVVGLDREWLDCFVGPDKLSPFVYVIRITEKNPKGDFLADESQDRVMLGFPSEEAALGALKANYDETLVVERVTSYYIWQFKEWLWWYGRSGEGYPFEHFNAPSIRLSDGESKPIAIDFDGVMARRRKTHHEQKAGARIDKGFELVGELRRQGLVPYIFTARTDLEFVEDWLRAEGLQIEVGNRKKPGTLAVVDDRAVDFEKQPLAGSSEVRRRQDRTCGNPQSSARCATRLRLSGMRRSIGLRRTSTSGRSNPRCCIRPISWRPS